MLNKFIGQGRLVRDIETRTAKNDTQIAMFTIACNRDYGEETDFIDCVAFKHNAGFVERNFHKGQMIGIVGRLESSKWEKDGQKRTKLKVRAMTVKFMPLPAPNQSRLTGEPIVPNANAAQQPPVVPQAGDMDGYDDDGSMPY